MKHQPAISTLVCGMTIATLLGLSQLATAADKKADASAMKPYTEELSGVDVKFDMLPIPGGEFLMGSPESEADRNEDEGPQVKVKIEPFWMGKYEVTWDEYDIWSFRLDIQRRKIAGVAATKRDEVSDAVTRPTPPYTDMTFGMGHDGYPAICMTQHAAKMYCRWLSEKTGHFYRLPTEAEWEYACRAGKTTAYSFGDSPDDLDDYGWFYDNSDEQYHEIGKKKPNPWGLYDMHGNVSEWVLDRYDADWYAKGAAKSPLNVPTDMYPRIVRGGSWDDDPDGLRSASRYASDPEWKFQDPQIPKSIWYHTDALHVGFRVIRPLNPPSLEVRTKLKLDPEPEIAAQGRAG
jgi:formylglycine-generating enzyme required for sulfatase activity